MGVQLTSFELEVTGPVRRIQDASTGKTSLTFTIEQAREAHAELGNVLAFVDGQNKARSDEPELPFTGSARVGAND